MTRLATIAVWLSKKRFFLWNGGSPELGGRGSRIADTAMRFITLQARVLATSSPFLQAFELFTIG
jgi:hypothetical protein